MISCEFCSANDEGYCSVYKKIVKGTDMCMSFRDKKAYVIKNRHTKMYYIDGGWTTSKKDALHMTLEEADELQRTDKKHFEVLKDGPANKN